MVAKVSYEVAKVNQHHVEAFLPRLRRVVLEELGALGLEPRFAVEESIANSTEAYALVLDGEVAAIFGILPAEMGATVWAMTSDVVDKKPISFARHSKHIAAILLGKRPVLSNWIDARHEECIRWFGWLGFKFVEQRLINGILFFRIEKEA